MANRPNFTKTCQTQALTGANLHSALLFLCAEGRTSCLDFPKHLKILFRWNCGGIAFDFDECWLTDFCKQVIMNCPRSINNSIKHRICSYVITLRFTEIFSILNNSFTQVHGEIYAYYVVIPHLWRIFSILLNIT